MRLHLGRASWNNLRKLGIQGLGIIEFDEAVGPIPKYVYSRHAKLIRRLLSDRAFSSKVSILAKYACEARLADNLIVVVEPFDSVGERIRTNYIVAQVSEEADTRKVRAILKALKRMLDGTARIERESIERLLRNIL